MELQVKTKQIPGKIEFNFGEIKENLTSMMELYKDAKFSEDTVITAKKEIATLRKIRDALDSRRIEIKKECLEPYNDFEVKVRELTALIDKPIKLIDGQVKVFEEKRRAEKKQKIQQAYEELIGELGEYLPLSKIYNNKWENTTTTLKSVKEEIEQVISSTNMAVQTIKGMNSDAATKALEDYKMNLSLADAVTYVNKYERQKAEILANEKQKHEEEEECKRKDEEDRIRREERERIAEENRIREEEKRLAEERVLSKQNISSEMPFVSRSSASDFDSELPFVTKDEIKSLFTLIGTAKELGQVELYLNSIGIYFERRDD